MKKSGKNIEKARKAVEPRPYTLQEAVPLLQKVKYAKFDETVEVTLRLGVDPKHADQMVRGTVVLPHGLGKSKKVLVIASGEKVREAEAAGADFVEAELEGLLAGTLLLGNAPAQVNLDQLDLALAAEAPQLGPGVPKQQATVLRYHAAPVHLTAGVQNDELS